MARPGIEPRTFDLRVRCPTDCATRPGFQERKLPVLVDNSNSGLVLYNQANFYRLRIHLVIGQLNECHFSLLFIGQPATPSGITVYNRTVINIENTVRVVCGCNSWFETLKEASLQLQTKMIL